ncbi:probable G-protein coupled receptor Mth-like 1 [Penaeus chinensis]|uniref:probable G-protein coupled receptor Mth-like 1 n=1 Tax=Penaeus chinensis TaxID=139456 RepID=UPI001FB644BC|nr:probable G-protein coupled receptor Mth-like 1 [Penaeus chinensis]
MRVPLCCADDVPCQRLPQQSVFSLPIALSHCNDPEERPVVFDVATDFCSDKNATKVILDRENKIIYTQNKLLFHWNMIFVNDFCVEVPTSSYDLQYRVLICSPVESSRHPEHCRAGVCHTKCCPEGYLLQNEYCVCYDAPASFIGPSLVGRSLKRGLLRGTDTFVRFPKCDSPDVITGNSTDAKNFFEFYGDDVNITDTSLDYCVDQLLDLQDSRNIVTTTLAVVVCPHHTGADESTWTVVRRVLIPLGLVVSCVFLAATLLCHLCLPALRDLRGLYLAAYVASLLVADSALFTTQAFSQFLAPASCVSLALLLHVAFLSTFFWLNVICYDVWTYVRLSVQGVPLHRTQDDMTRFLVRSVYAWGCPLIMGIVAAVMQLLPEDKDGYLKPNFVANRCWFRDGVEILAYFYGPMGILCIVNTLLILHTGLVLYCANNRCHCFFGSCGQTNHTFDRQHLNEFWQRFGLFAIMASCWLTEVISSIVGSGDSELWAVTDTLNTFQGVFIFITFIRSTKRRRLVQERLEAWVERVERGGLPAPSLPAGMSPSHLLHRLRTSSVWASLGRAHDRAPCRRRPHLSSKQVLDNIIFKEKMEDKKGFNNQAFDEEERDEDPDGEFSRADSVNRSANPIWTVPRWRSLRSNTYFPNEVGDKDDANDAPRKDDDVICENFVDSLSIYSSYSEDGDQRSSASENPQNQRPIFAQWNLLRLKSGSLNLPSGGFAGGAAAGKYSDVVCQGLTRKDSFSKK